MMRAGYRRRGTYICHDIEHRGVLTTENKSLVQGRHGKLAPTYASIIYLTSVHTPLERGRRDI